MTIAPFRYFPCVRFPPFCLMWGYKYQIYIFTIIVGGFVLRKDKKIEKQLFNTYI